MTDTSTRTQRNITVDGIDLDLIRADATDTLTPDPATWHAGPGWIVWAGRKKLGHVQLTAPGTWSFRFTKAWARKLNVNHRQLPGGSTLDDVLFTMLARTDIDTLSRKIDQAHELDTNLFDQMLNAATCLGHADGRAHKVALEMFWDTRLAHLADHRFDGEVA